MSIFENTTSYNPLYLEDATGLDADFDEAVLEQDTNDFLAKRKARKNRAIFDDFESEGDEYGW